uniref:Uncharacterized protein n=1 Tax=Schizaphis graminum TaxID=13262 RepID=A0A2S2NJN3_SCHGA
MIGMDTSGLSLDGSAWIRKRGQNLSIPHDHITTAAATNRTTTTTNQNRETLAFRFSNYPVTVKTKIRRFNKYTRQIILKRTRFRLPEGEESQRGNSGPCNKSKRPRYRIEFEKKSQTRKERNLNQRK